MKIHENLANFESQCQFYTWIYRITENTIKNFYRSRQQEAFFPLTMVHFEESVYEVRSPEDDCALTEMAEHIGKLVNRLPNSVRYCIYLQAIHGDSYEEIAKEMHCSVGTVRSRLSRARQFLNHYLHDH